MRISILNTSKTPASVLNRANKLRLRLCGGRPLTQSPEQFQSEIALKSLNALTPRESAARRNTACGCCREMQFWQYDNFKILSNTADNLLWVIKKPDQGATRGRRLQTASKIPRRARCFKCGLLLRLTSCNLLYTSSAFNGRGARRPKGAHGREHD